MRKIVKRVVSKPLQIWAKWYFKKPRKYRYKNIKGIILPEVFYPYFTISTKLLLEFLEEHDLKNKHFLELGCGTGMISVLASKKGAKVTASDINPKAVENVQVNAQKNGVILTAVLSDLFSNLQNQQYDYIVINPPYYPKSPTNKAEEAWFCGENFEYFEKLFPQLKNHISSTSKVYMILSEDCQIEHIKKIAIAHNLQFKIELKTKRQNEENYIFSITKRPT